VFLFQFSKTFLLQIKVCVVIHLVADWFGSWLITLLKIPMGKMNGKNTSRTSANEKVHSICCNMPEKH